jgi:hypothetical protein
MSSTPAGYLNRAKDGNGNGNGNGTDRFVRLLLAATLGACTLIVVWGIVDMGRNGITPSDTLNNIAIALVSAIVGSITTAAVLRKP